MHLELVGTVENVARAKAELIEALPPGGTAVVPEEPLLEPYLTRDDIEIRRFGHVEEPGVFRVGDREIRLETSYSRAPPARQHARRAAPSATCSASPSRTARSRSSSRALREEELELADGVLLINDCYNANPLSMRAALEHLAERAGDRRRVAVLGEMAELGEAAPRLPPRASARPSREAGVDELIARRPARARATRPPRTASTRARGHRRRGGRRARASCSGRATSCSSRARVRWDSKRSRRNSRG